MDCDREISGHIVGVQACWLEHDYIEANVGISNGRRGMNYHTTWYKLRIAQDGKITYPGLVTYVWLDRLKLTYEQYDTFLTANKTEILDLIEGLLTPDERKIWERRKSGISGRVQGIPARPRQMGLF